MHVWVAELQHQLAGLTLATWLARLPSPAVHRLFTQKGLGQPQRQPLLPHPPWAFEEERLWQPAGGNSAYQPVADPLMAVQGGD